MNLSTFRWLYTWGTINPPGEAFIISADSNLEAQAFLYCLVNSDATEFLSLRDRILVFDNPNQLKRLISKSPYFIAVTANQEVEKELAQHINNVRCILIHPRNTTNTVPHISLEPLPYEVFRKALNSSGCNDDQIKLLNHESGRSLTILRRRLSKTEAIKTPFWASNTEIARSLIPFLFAGAWKSSNANDKAILKCLSGDLDYSTLEQQLVVLHQLEDSPVWSAGSFNGLVSKIDVLFSISKWITEADITRFIDVATLVLSEDDPSLDLPKEERWMANIYGKTRDISSTLRDGICETLVLLSVYGNQLLQQRLGIDLETKVGQLIRDLLTPLTVRKLEAHANDLPMYAEAAPTVFLDILEQDLASENPQALEIMRPVSASLFEQCYRSGLLWALENLAWSEKYLVRTVLILGKLAKQAIDDNVMNKPSSSLGSIFRSWMPQTSASVDDRILVFELLAKSFPEVAWPLAVVQFDGQSRTGYYSHKPRWRTDGHGYGEPVNRMESNKFAFHVLTMAINWENHNLKTLSDLVSCLPALEADIQVRIWELVESWSTTASEEDKSTLREKIRVHTFSRRAVRRQNKQGKQLELEKARAVYAALAPQDVVLRHEWLFLKSWVDESIEEMGDDIDWETRESRIFERRKQALSEIIEVKGIAGVLGLAEKGEAANTIGWIIPHVQSVVETLTETVFAILSMGPINENPVRHSLLFGILKSLSQEQAKSIIPTLIERLDVDVIVTVLGLCPFNFLTWDELSKLPKALQDQYWQVVPLQWSNLSEEELRYGMDKLIEVKRPRSAFYLTRFDFSKIHPKQLSRLLLAIGMEETDTEPEHSHQLESYAVTDAIQFLAKSGELSTDDLAFLEFKYIDAFDSDNEPIPNLELQMEKHPEWFIQSVVFSYKRDDRMEDPPEMQADNEEQKSNRAHRAYKMLQNLSRIPGHNPQGLQTTEAILEWIDQVHSECRKLGREQACNHALGKLFSNAPEGNDAIWPSEPVRDAIEQIINHELAMGLRTALYNKRGVVTREEGGGQERDMASRFNTWAQGLRYTHPKLSKVLSEVVEIYNQEAQWHDSDAVARRRLGF